jgi:hypothetical protein
MLIVDHGRFLIQTRGKNSETGLLEITAVLCDIKA